MYNSQVKKSFNYRESRSRESSGVCWTLEHHNNEPPRQTHYSRTPQLLLKNKLFTILTGCRSWKHFLGDDWDAGKIDGPRVLKRLVAKIDARIGIGGYLTNEDFPEPPTTHFQPTSRPNWKDIVRSHWDRERIGQKPLNASTCEILQTKWPEVSKVPFFSSASTPP